MKCKNCGHNIRKHIKVGKSFYCIDDHKDYGGKLVYPTSQDQLSSGANVHTSGCVAPYQDQYTGGFKGCGDAWSLGKGNSLGATMFQ